MTNEEELLYNEIYKKTKDCGRIQFVKLLQQKEIENKKLRESLKATEKGLNKVLSKRKKWKDKYHEEQNKNKWLQQRDTYTDIVHSQFQLEKKEKRYYENILDELEKWLEEEKGIAYRDCGHTQRAYQRCYDKLKKLKGFDNV